MRLLGAIAGFVALLGLLAGIGILYVAFLLWPPSMFFLAALVLFFGWQWRVAKRISTQRALEYALAQEERKIPKQRRPTKAIPHKKSDFDPSLPSSLD